MAVAHNGLGAYDQALALMEEIKEDKLTGLGIEKAYALSRLERFDEALELYLKENQDSVFINTEIAYIYSRQDRYDLEEPFIRRAYEGGRQDAWVLSEYAKVMSYEHHDYERPSPC